MGFFGKFFGTIIPDFFRSFFLASRKGGIGLGTLALLFILGYFLWSSGTLASIMGGSGNGGTGGGIKLDAPVNVNLLDSFTGAPIDGEGIEFYAAGSTVTYDSWDVDSDTASDSAKNFISGQQYFVIVCDGTAAQVTGVGCEGTDGGVREFGAADAVRGVSVTIPFASNTQQTQHNIVISLKTNFDDGTGEDMSWTVVSGTAAMTDNDGSTTDNDYSGDGGTGVGTAEVSSFTATRTHRVTIANVNDNTGWNEVFTFPDSGNTVDLRLIIQLRNENGTGTARITDMPNLYATGGASPTNWYDLGSAIGCFQREVVGTVIKQQGVCSYTFTAETGTYTAASAFTQVTLYLVQYFDAGYFKIRGAANPEAFLDAATTDCTFDFFITDA